MKRLRCENGYDLGKSLMEIYEVLKKIFKLKCLVTSVANKLLQVVITHSSIFSFLPSFLECKRGGIEISK